MMRGVLMGGVNNEGRVEVSVVGFKMSCNVLFVSEVIFYYLLTEAESGIPPKC